MVTNARSGLPTHHSLSIRLRQRDLLANSRTQWLALYRLVVCRLLAEGPVGRTEDRWGLHEAQGQVEGRALDEPEDASKGE